MTHGQFHTAALDLVKSYWRIKAASALYRRSSTVTTDRLEYANVPAVGMAVQNFQNETVAEAMMALQSYVAQRLPRNSFLALIAEFECRIVERLRLLGESGDGTLGALQARIQARILVPQALVEDLNEVRERRNAMIHHGDIANARYVAAAAAVLPRSGHFVTAAVAGDNVSPTEAYLAYSADVLVRYSSCIG